MHDLTRELIDRLATLTREGRIPWVEGPGQNAFGFEADGYAVSVDAAPSGPMIVVADSEGRELEALTGEELSESRNAEGLDYETVVREMHASARRAALGTDEAIKRILTTLSPGGEAGGRTPAS